jgi:hypothetical protein
MLCPDWLAWAVPRARHKACFDSPAVRSHRSLLGRARLTPFALIGESSPVRLTSPCCHRAHFPSPFPQAITVEVTAGERAEATILFRADEPLPFLLRCRSPLTHATHLLFFSSCRMPSQTAVATAASSPRAPPSTSLCAGEASTMFAPLGRPTPHLAPR